MCCGWYEAPDKWRGVTDWYWASRWYPAYGFPSVTLGGALFGIRNFEFFFFAPDGDDVTPGFLWKLCERMTAMHKTYGGRSEVRYGSSIMFLDCGGMTKNFDQPERVLHKLGVRNLGSHTGKWYLPRQYLEDLFPLEEKMKRYSMPELFELHNKARAGRADLEAQAKCADAERKLAPPIATPARMTFLSLHAVDFV